MGRKKIKIEHIQDERNRAVRTRRGGCEAHWGGREAAGRLGARRTRTGEAICRSVGDAAPDVVLAASAWPSRRCAGGDSRRGTLTVVWLLVAGSVSYGVDGWNPPHAPPPPPPPPLNDAGLRGVGDLYQAQERVAQKGAGAVHPLRLRDCGAHL